MYRYWLDPLAREVPDTSQLDVPTLARLLSAIRELGCAPATTRQCYVTFGIFFRWLMARGVLPPARSDAQKERDA